MTSVHIPDMRAAIEAGDIPGSFVDKRREFRFNTLAYNTSRGATNLWTISVRLMRDKTFVPIPDSYLQQPVPPIAGHIAEISVETQQKGGKIRDVVPTYVSTGKNLGKKSATNVITQAIRDALGTYNKQAKRHDISEIIPASESKDDEEDAEADEANDEFEVNEVVENDGQDDISDDSSETKVPPKARVALKTAVVKSFDPMPPPMLVKKLGETKAATPTKKDFDNGMTAQMKYDGIRSAGFFDPETGSFTRYSRTGTLLPRQAHIDDQMATFKKFIPSITPGTYGVDTDASPDILAAYGAIHTDPDHYGDPIPYFDAELYKHGVSLNNIVGQARRTKNEGKLEYRIYDVFFPYAKAAGHDMLWKDRMAYLETFASAINALPHSHIEIVPNFKNIKSIDEAETLAKQFIKEGYEGAILRKNNAGYEYGYGNRHSDNLVKIKPTMDSEFPVVGFTQGEKGKAVGAIIWECSVPNPINKKDDRFTVVPKMTIIQRQKLFQCLSKLVDGPDGKKITRFERDVKGLPLTIAYAGLSPKTGKPLQPRAVAFRTYEQGSDPILKLFKECL